MPAYIGQISVNKAYIKAGASTDGWTHVTRGGAHLDHWVHIGSEHRQDYWCFSVTLFWFFITFGWVKK